MLIHRQSTNTIIHLHNNVNLSFSAQCIMRVFAKSYIFAQMKLSVIWIDEFCKEKKDKKWIQYWLLRLKTEEGSMLTPRARWLHPCDHLKPLLHLECTQVHTTSLGMHTCCSMKVQTYQCSAILQKIAAVSMRVCKHAVQCTLTWKVS